MTRTLLKRSAPLAVLAAALLLTRCNCDFFGNAGGLIIPEAKEMQLGAQFDSTLRHTQAGKDSFPIFVPRNAAEAQFEQYVINLAKDVYASVPASQKPGYNFTFTIIRKDVENAFAVPGGYVYVYTGIIKKMQDESELAGVLGHEMAHVTWHHYRDAVAKMAGGALLIEVLLGDNASQLAQLVAGSLFQLAALSVTRSNESEADHYGTLYTGRAGRNPLGIAKYFARVKEFGFKWLSSHPGSGDRVEAVTEQVEETPELKAVAADTASNFTSRFVAATAAIR